jgi:hypothetical protein
MGKRVTGFVCMLSVSIAIGGTAYSIGCSTPDRDYTISQGLCDIDNNPCTIEDCSRGGVIIGMLPEGTVVDAGSVPECNQLVCHFVNGESEAMQVSMAYDTSCSLGVCDDAGQCVDSCNDGRQNGDEKGVDCGGDHCKSCIVASCDSNDECNSGHCASGVCCDQPCSGECESCETGTCFPVPFNTEAKTCKWPNACDGDRNCKIGTGASCDGKTGADCVGGSCRGRCGANTVCHDGNVSGCGGFACGNSTCVNTWGKPCNGHAECDTENCVAADAGTDAQVCYN